MLARPRSQFASLAAALIALALVVLALPALAAAAPIQVNSTEDEPDASTGTGTCETAAGNARCGRRSRPPTPWPGRTP